MIMVTKNAQLATNTPFCILYRVPHWLDINIETKSQFKARKKEGKF